MPGSGATVSCGSGIAAAALAVLAPVLAPASPERIENQRAVTMLERDIAAGGGGAKGKDAIGLFVPERGVSVDPMAGVSVG